MKPTDRYGVLLAAVATILSSLCAHASPAQQIRAATGQRTRVVWIRSSGGIGHPFGPHSGEKWRVMVLDTDEDGGRERQLVPDWGDFHHTMITPNGRRVIWSDCHEQVWICNWDGTRKQVLLKAKLAVGVAEDPPGMEWVYVHGGNTVRASNSDQMGSVYRYQIDNPSERELVWDKTGSNDKWEFTRDGRLGASGLPWPHAGIASLPNGEFKLVGDGCTPGVAADGSLVMHMKASGHSGVFLYNADGSGKRYIDFRSQAPGIEGVPDPQFWWASFARYDKRFITFSGPHPSMGYKQSKGNIYFCRFNGSFTNIDTWVQVTNFPEVETHAYAWIGDPCFAPNIVKHPSSQTANEGEEVKFAVEATGEPLPEYQWQGNGAAVASANASELTVKASRDTNNVRFRCVISNSKGRVTSKDALLTVNLKGPNEEQAAEWDARLQARLRESLDAGVRPALKPASRRERREVASMDRQGTISVEISKGMQLGMKWSKLTPQEKANLAKSVLRIGKPADHCLVAYYLLLSGEYAEVEEHLAKGGKQAATVRSMFE